MGNLRRRKMNVSAMAEAEAFSDYVRYRPFERKLPSAAGFSGSGKPAPDDSLGTKSFDLLSPEPLIYHVDPS